MKRLNFTLDDQTVSMLESLSESYFEGNKSQTVRVALESLKSHIGNTGWVISGYTPLRLNKEMTCHSCGETAKLGDVLYRPVFERGTNVNALKELPSENWVECSECIESR